MIIRILLAALCGLPLASREARRPVTFESLYSFPAPTGLAPSPDGRRILYTLSQGDVEQDTAHGSLWVMDADGRNPRRLAGGVGSPRWSGDGRAVTYLAFEGGAGQLVRQDLESGRMETLTRIPGGIGEYLWLPDGSGILCTRTVPATPAAAAWIAGRAGRRHSGLVYDTLLHRPYSRWDDGTVSHVFHYRVATGELRDLTPGPHAAPASHLGGIQDLALSPDGRTVAYTSNTDPVHATSTNNDVFLVELDGSGPRRLTTRRGNDTYPVFSPDGRQLTYTEMATPGYESEQKDLILVDLQGGSRRNLTADFDLSVGEVAWVGGALYLTCKEKGFDALYRLDLPSGRITNLVRGKVFSRLALAPDAQSFLCITSAMDRPAEIARYDLRTHAFTPLTHLADGFVDTHALARSEVTWFKGALGDDVMAFVTRPEPFDPARTYPVVFLFHGGPEGDWDGSWSNYVANAALVAAQGYVVVKPNIHGAASYGRKFLEAILNNWGRVDEEDVLKCLDHVLATYPYADGRRVGAIGRSYGGFLVNWLNGRTDRFACFVSIDGLFDQLSCYYACDELWFPEHEFGGTPVERREEYLRASPATHAGSFRTPTLVLHGGRDYRVDPSQGLGMYTALQRRGIPSRLVYFPDEPHYFRRLQNWKFAFEEQFAWLAKHLKAK